MKTKPFILLGLLLVLLTGCAPSQAAIQTAIAQTQAVPPSATSPATLTPAPSPTPTSTFTPAPPTATATPTPTPTLDVKALGMPDPRQSDPALFDLVNPSAPIPQFVRALNQAGVQATPEQVAASLVYAPLTGRDGDPAVLLVTTDLPETPFDESGVPLMVYMKDPQTGKYAWSEAYLKDVAALHGIRMGALVNSAEEFYLNSITGMFSKNFNVANVPYDTNVPSSVMDRDTNYRLSRIAGEHLDEIMFFHLGWQASQKALPTREQAVKAVNDQVDLIAQKYGNIITIASVLNEIHNGYPVYSTWMSFGDAFLTDIYAHARQALPKAKLIYNETYNYSQAKGTFYQQTLMIVKILAEKNLIDAVGMQMHMGQNQDTLNTPIDVDEASRIMQSFGLPVYVTELDVNQTYMQGTDQEKLVQQADLYEKVVRACVRSGVCPLINFWGQADPWSWYLSVNEPQAKACLFDGNGAAKLAYYAVLRGLTEGFVSQVP